MRSTACSPRRGLKLDAVIELKVDEGILRRAYGDADAADEGARRAPRADDNSDALHRRLLAYRDQTAPLTGYFQLQSVLRSVDGMAAVDEVSRAIDTVLRKTKEKTPAKKAAKKSAGNTADKSANKSVSKKAAPKPAAAKVNAPKSRKGGTGRAGEAGRNRTEGGRKGAKKPTKPAKSARPPRKVAARKATSRKSIRPQRLTKRR